MIRTEQFKNDGKPGCAELQALEAMVDAFAGEMKHRLLKKFLCGYRGWDDPQNRRMLREKFGEHIKHGDGHYVDIANLAAMLWNMEQEKPGKMEEKTVNPAPKMPVEFMAILVDAFNKAEHLTADQFEGRTCAIQDKNRDMVCPICYFRKMVKHFLGYEVELI